MTSTDSRSPAVAAVVLAAGSSQRMGAPNKLLLPVDGAPMLSHALRAAQGCGAERVFVVTGHQRESVMALVDTGRVVEIYNPDHGRGQDSSIAAAMAAIAPLRCSALVLLGDQPGVSAPLLRRLLQAHGADGGRRALVPTFAGRWGTPRILPAALVARAARGGAGFSVRRALSSGEVDCQLLAVDNLCVVTDIDTPADYRAHAAGALDARRPSK